MTKNDKKGKLLASELNPFQNKYLYKIPNPISPITHKFLERLVSQITQLKTNHLLNSTVKPRKCSFSLMK